MSAPCPTFGFVVRMELAAARDVAGLRRGWDALLEARGLCCESLDGATRLAYAVASDAAQATENDRVAVGEWLRGRDELRAWEIGELVDLSEGLSHEYE